MINTSKSGNTKKQEIKISKKTKIHLIKSIKESKLITLIKRVLESKSTTPRRPIFFQEKYRAAKVNSKIIMNAYYDIKRIISNHTK